ncbi:MAG: hypothetical protein OEM40_09765, partial [Acidimicrobiia bacterium]|nr:hypothetical protein [Acidimicrobiia bacterium]
ELARCNLLGGMTDDVRTAVVSIADRVNEATGAALFDGKGFAAGMETGDFGPFVDHLATDFGNLPDGAHKLWYDRDLSDEEAGAIASLTTVAPAGWWTTLVTMMDLTNELLTVFIDTIDEHRYTCGPVRVKTLSMLETDFTGLASHRTKQPFQAKYVVEFDGDITEACVTFNCRFEGSRLDKVDYPMAAQATMANGSTLILTPEVVADSDYNELHKVAICANARTVEVSVNGTAHWADWLGSLSGIGSLPHGKVCVGGVEHSFGERDGIWAYGWSK